MILSLDASTQRGSVALFDGRQVARELFPETPRGRGGALFNALEELLRDAPAIRRVVVGIGPGSYNGVRSAIAAAWGIAIARKIPLVGISSVLGLDDGDYFARRRCATPTVFPGSSPSRGNFVIEPKLLTREKLEAELQQSTTSADLRFCAHRVPPQGNSFEHPSAGKLGALAADLAPDDPQPLYLKAAHITTPKRVDQRL